MQSETPTQVDVGHVADAAAGRRAFGRSRWVLRMLETLAWSAVVLAAVMVLALRYWVLPNIEQHRDVIVGAFVRGLGLPVKVGAIQADWPGIRPRISFADVRIYDHDGREALVLPAVHNVVSWRSLLFAELRLSSLIIDSPRLAVRRDAAGRLFVAGLELAAAGGAERGGRLAAWILGQREIEIRNAEIEWVDLLREAPPLKLSALNLRLRNAGGVHAVGLSARPPKALGTSLVVRAELAGGPVTVPSKWDGRLYAEFGDTDLAAWQPWVDYPFELRQGRGAVRMWVTLGAGQRVRSTLDVELSNVVMQLATDLPRLALAKLAGRLEGRAEGRTFELTARDLALTLADGEALEPTSFHLSWTPAAEADPAKPERGERGERGALIAKRIDLAPLARLGEFLPFPQDLRRLLADLSPRGQLHDVAFDWTGTLPHATGYYAQARFDALGMNAWHAVPGFTGLTGRIEARSGGGRVELLARDLALDLPKLFPQPRIALDTLTGLVAWQQPDSETVRVQLSSLAFGNAHLAGTAFGTVTLGREGPGVVDLSAALSRADGKSTASYLPLASIVGKDTRAWIERAILDGRATDVRFQLKGDLREFPFTDPARGQMLISARIDGAVLDYAAGWPKIDAIDGTVRFDGERIELLGRSARVLGVQLANIRVAIPSLLSAETDLLIEGDAVGPSNEFLKFIEASPVRQMTDAFTVGMRAEGEGRLSLKLHLPLANLANTKVSGGFEFASKRILVHPQLPAVESVKGSVRFGETGLRQLDVQGSLLGGLVVITGRTAPQGGVRVVARGKASAGELAGLLEHPWLRYLSGSAAYEVVVNAEGGVPSVTVSSDLKGVESSLPPPLAKRAADSLPLRLRLLPGAGPAQQRVSVTLGRVMVAEFLRQRRGEDQRVASEKGGKDAKGGNGDKGGTAGTGETMPPLPPMQPMHPMQVTRTLIVLNPTAGAPVPQPTRDGLTLRGTFDALDLDTWRALPDDGWPALGQGTFDLKAGVLDVFGRRLRDVDVRAGSDVGGWSAQVTSAELDGNIAYRAEGSGLLVARLKRFRIPADSPGGIGADGKGGRKGELPAVDLLAERFTLFGRELGRAEIAARPAAGAWEIDKLVVLNPDAELRGKGTRTLTQGTSRTSVDFALKVTDVGKFLSRVGYAKMVQGANGRLDGSLAWQGDPQVVDYPSLEGKLTLRINDGQFLEIEPGLGKLVGLISMQALPRRITLDYRDVFSDGFKFDLINGSIEATRGVMSTTDFKMSGPAAEVDMQGRTDLAAETQDLRVKIVPSVGDTASAAVALLNPIVGAAALLAQRVLDNPLGQILAYEYAITGSWADPQVKKLGVEPQERSGPYVDVPF